MPSLADRVKETTLVEGTGSYTLDGATTGYQAFSAAFSNGDTVAYAVEDGTDWEVGEGVLTSGTPWTLARTTILSSSNAGAAVAWGAGVKSIFCTLPAGVVTPLLAPEATFDLGFVNGGDYSGIVARAVPQRPLVSLVKETDPTSLPSGDSLESAFSPNGEYLAIAMTGSPFVEIYKREGRNFVKLANPATLPAGAGASLAWSPNSEFLAVGHSTSPFVTIYQRAGDVFTKLANPATLPAGTGNGVAWSPNGEFLAVAHPTSPFVTIYRRAGTTFTKVTNPAALPAGNGNHVAFSPDGVHLVVGVASAPFLAFYRRSGTTFTKLSDPAAVPVGGTSALAFSPSGDLLFLGVAGATKAFAYTRSGDTFTQIVDPVPVDFPASIVHARFSLAGRYLFVFGFNGTEPVAVFERSGNVFVRGPAIGDQPPFGGYSGTISPDLEFLVATFDYAPRLRVWRNGSVIPQGSKAVVFDAPGLGQ